MSYVVPKDTSESSTSNTSTTPLTGGATFTGTADTSTYPDILVSCKSDVAGTLYIDFSNDGTNWDTFPPDGFTVSAGVHEFHTAVKGPRQFRVRYVNGASAQSYFRLYTYSGFFSKNANAPIGFTIADDADAIVTKSVLSGIGNTTVTVTNNRALRTVPAPEGQTSFGEAIVGNLTPTQQLSFLYSLNPDLFELRDNGGTSSLANSMLSLSTGAAANQSSTFLSNRVIKYEPGLGCRARVSAVFTTGVANSTQIIGIGNSSDGFFFGYNGTSFGILHRKDGAPEIRTLTVTTASTTAENITVTLDGDADATVAVTNSGNLTTTANEIAAHDYSDVGRGWKATAVGATVVFTSWDSSSRTGTYSISGTTVVGTFAQTLAGASPTDTWTPQASWNGQEIFDGNGLTGITLDPTTGNVFQIDFQYLGFGQIRFYVEDPDQNEFHLVHIINYGNANTTPSLSNPSLRLMAAAENTSSTTDISLKTASMAAFVDGKRVIHGIERCVETTSTVAASGETPFLSIRLSETFNSIKSEIEFKINKIIAALEHTKPAVVKVYLNPTLTDASFTAIDATTSSIFKDTSTTAITGGRLLDAIPLAKAGNNQKDLTFDLNVFRIQSGDTLTFTLSYSSGTNAEVYLAVSGWEIL